MFQKGIIQLYFIKLVTNNEKTNTRPGPDVSGQFQIACHLKDFKSRHYLTVV